METELKKNILSLILSRINYRWQNFILVVVVDNPNHIMSYSEIFMGNINDDDVSIEYEQDKLIETIN